MQKHLFFVCPTDHLETVIDKHFDEENYYLTSLGNSVDFDSEIIEEINTLIEAKSITEISFVLSDTNKIIMDALEREEFKGVTGLESFYESISEPKKRTEVLRHVFQTELPLINQYLQMKVRGLKHGLNFWFSDKVSVNAKVYRRQTNVFKEANTNLIELECFCLN